MYLLGLCLLCLLPQDKFDFVSVHPTQNTYTAQSEVARDAFHQAVLAAIPAAREAGLITRAEGVRIRVAMISPAFRARAQELAVVQMVFSESENVPMNPDGTVNQAAINWGGLTEFIKVLLPLLLELLIGLGIGG